LPCFPRGFDAGHDLLLRAEPGPAYPVECHAFRMIAAFKLEDNLGIIGSMLRRHESGGGFRTVDGGHPAPYPDMTDEQLYNYEIAFNVTHKTFERRPASATASTAKPAPASTPPPAPKAASGKVLDAARFTGRRPVPAAPRPARRSAGPLDLSKPVRLVTTGQPVDIITTRARHPVFKVHGYIGDDSVATVFTLQGQLSENGPCYLENVPEQRQLHLNIYPDPEASGADKYLITQHATRQEADAAATPERLACTSVKFDY